MLLEPTFAKLQQMQLYGLAEALREQLEQSGIAELPFEERFSLLR